MKKDKTLFGKLKHYWHRCRRQCTINNGGFDVHQAVDNCNVLVEENKKLKDEIAALNTQGVSKNRYDELVLENERLNRQIESFYTLHNDFPSMLRKMWSGSEVVAWIKEQQRVHLSNHTLGEESENKNT